MRDDDKNAADVDRDEEAKPDQAESVWPFGQ